MIFLFPFGILWVFMLLFFGMRVMSNLFRDPRRNRHIDESRTSRDTIGGRGNPRNLREIFGGGYRITESGGAEHQIFRLANKLKGRLTVSDVVIHTGLSVSDAEGTMNRLVDGMHVKMEVDNQGIVVYEFPEIIARFEQNW